MIYLANQTDKIIVFKIVKGIEIACNNILNIRKIPTIDISAFIVKFRI